MFVGTVLLGLLPTAASACRCTAPSPRAAVRTADGVVLGRIVSSDPTKDGAINLTIAVAQAWKHAFGAELVVYGSPVCSFEPVVGANYVVFLRRNPEGHYETDSCMGNKAEDRAEDVLHYLRQHP